MDCCAAVTTHGQPHKGRRNRNLTTIFERDLWEELMALFGLSKVWTCISVSLGSCPTCRRLQTGKLCICRKLFVNLHFLYLKWLATIFSLMTAWLHLLAFFFLTKKHSSLSGRYLSSCHESVPKIISDRLFILQTLTIGLLENLDVWSIPSGELLGCFRQFLING